MLFAVAVNDVFEHPGISDGERNFLRNGTEEVVFIFREGIPVYFVPDLQHTDTFFTRGKRNSNHISGCKVEFVPPSCTVVIELPFPLLRSALFLVIVVQLGYLVLVFWYMVMDYHWKWSGVHDSEKYLLHRLHTPKIDGLFLGRRENKK